MSTNSSSLPGNEESSTSSSLALVVGSPASLTQTSAPCSSTPLPTASSPTVGVSWVESYFTNFLNQGRMGKRLTPDPNGQRSLNPKTPTKWALLQVLSTGCALTIFDIRYVLLWDLSYRRSKGSLLRALNRCVKFGLVSVFGRRQHRLWKMTTIGKDLANTPPKKTMTNFNCASELIRPLVVGAKRWMCVSDLANALPGTSRGSIGRALRKEPMLYKGMVIPDDRYNRKQWASVLADTTGWLDAIPTPGPPRTRNVSKKKKTATPVSAVVASSPSYKGFNLMCVPANKPSLIRAVGDLVLSEFVPAQKKFSAHDVTKRLREQVLQQVEALDPVLRQTYVPIVDPFETGYAHVSGKQVSKIEHEDVKGIVHELFQVQAFAGYGRVHVGSHWEYDLLANLPVITPDPSPIAISSPTTSPSPDPAVAGVAGAAYDGSSTI